MTGVPNPDGIPCNDCGIPFNFDRLGVRVPTVVISPWVAKGGVVHEPPAFVKPNATSQFELSSIPATLHRVFNTPNFLTARDAWAAPFDFIWDPTWSNITAPRTDCPLTLPDVPAGAQSPSQVGRVIGAAPLSPLQQDLLHLTLGVTGAARTPADVAAHATLVGDAAIGTEGAAGMHIRQLVTRKLAQAAAERAALAAAAQPVEAAAATATAE